MSDEQAGQSSAVPAAAPATPEPAPQPAISQSPEADKAFDPVVESIMSGSGGAADESQPAPEPPAPAVSETPPAPVPAPQAQEPDGLDLDDPELSEDDLRQAERAKHAFASLKGKLKKARDDGQFGNLIRRMGEAAELNPDILARWVDLGARLNRNDPSATQDLGRLLGAQRLKIVSADAPAPPAPPAAPTAPPAPAPAMDRVKALAEQLFSDEFKSKVDDMSMGEDAARLLSLKMAERLLRAQAVPPSPALSQPISEPPSQPSAAPAPTLSFIQQAALDEVGKYAQAYDARIPEFRTAVLPEVTRRILAQRQATGVTSPLQWVSEFNDMVRQVQAERAKPVAKPVQTSSLRPSTQTKGQSRTYTDVRESIADSIMGGGLPD